jgi:HAD superfamily hydrolase (TIGR01549 family)
MRALIFDMDDTLYDLSRHRRMHLARAWQSWLTMLTPERAAAVVEAAVSERIFFPDMAGFLFRHGVHEIDAREKLIDASRETWFDDLTLDDGVAQLLDALAGHYRLGLITNGPTAIQQRKIDRFGLTTWFSQLTISQNFGVEKPHSRIFLHMVDALGAEVADTVMVGDNPLADIAGATGVGMRAVWIRHPHVIYPAELPTPWRTIDHVTALPGVLEQA